jgi:phosphoesterase RecJ-like protein
MTREIQRAAQLLREKGSFFLATHRQPDGDALGATLALAAVLRQMGKRVVVHLSEPAPRLYRFLPGIEGVTRRGPEGCEVAVVLDCGSLSRVGPVAGELAEHPLLINIDHHQTGGGFGQIELVDSTACAAGELVRRLIAAIPWQITPPVALNLYVAVASDTGNFQNASTDRRAFELAAEMSGHGVRADDIARRLFDDYSLPRLRLLGLALSGLETLAEGRLALVSVSRRMLEAAGAGLEDCAGLINQISQMAGVKVVAMLTEAGAGQVEVSLRSRNGVNVASVAEGLGGGGHPNAAGCALSGGLEEARRRIIDVLGAALEGQSA